MTDRDTVVRHSELKVMLTERRREMQDQVQNKIRDRRTDRPKEGGDDLEHSDADTQGEIQLVLLQMRSETLSRIDLALVRLEAGKYGHCIECEEEIAQRRLKALPFAVRCQSCEEKREEENGQTQKLARRREGVSLFGDVITT